MVLKPGKRLFVLVGVGHDFQTDLVCRNETLEGKSFIDNKFKL